MQTIFYKHLPFSKSDHNNKYAGQNPKTNIKMVEDSYLYKYMSKNVGMDRMFNEYTVLIL